MFVSRTTEGYQCETESTAANKVDYYRLYLSSQDTFTVGTDRQWLRKTDRRLHIHRNTHTHLARIHLSPWTAVNTSKQPAVPGLLDQNGNYLSPGEGQQGVVGATRLVGRPGPHVSASWRARNASLGRRRWRDEKWNTGADIVVKAQVRW